MKRTTIYLDPELKLEARRSKKPVAEIIREAVRDKLHKNPPRLPAGAGAFDSGYTDGAERFEEILGELGFGDGGSAALKNKTPALGRGF